METAGLVCYACMALVSLPVFACWLYENGKRGALAAAKAFGMAALWPVCLVGVYVSERRGRG